MTTLRKSSPTAFDCQRFVSEVNFGFQLFGAGDSQVTGVLQALFRPLLLPLFVLEIMPDVRRIDIVGCSSPCPGVVP